MPFYVPTYFLPFHAPISPVLLIIKLEHKLYKTLCKFPTANLFADNKILMCENLHSGSAHNQRMQKIARREQITMRSQPNYLEAVLL